MPAATAGRCSTASARRLGYERTAELLSGRGLEVDLAAQEHGPLGPLMNGRRAHLEAEGLLDPTQQDEDVLVVRGRKRPCGG